MKTLRRLLLFAFSLVAVVTNAADDAKTKVLVVTGGHGFDREPFFAMFRDNAEISFTAAEHNKTNASVYERDDLLSYDTVVLYDMPREITDAQKGRFLSLFDRGIGLVVLHHALVSYQSWPEYEQIIGGRYQEPEPNKPGRVTEAVGWQHDAEVPVVIVATNHPVTAGLKNFTLHDEIYWGFRVGSDVTPLITTTHPKSGKPLGWSRTEGKSRVVFLQLGHGKEAFASENYRQLVAQAIRWTAQRRQTETALTVALDMEHPGATISPAFTGLSFEAAILLPNENGVRYFRPDNEPLIRLFRQLGIKSLRIGGNTSDRDARRLPGDADLDCLFGFAKAADVKVIYCLRLLNGDPNEEARKVKYIMDRYTPQVECFSIGQEPSAYPAEKVDTRSSLERMGAAAEKFPYARYRDEWKRFADLIVAAVPDVKFCGPCVHNNADWARKFMADFGRSNRVAMIMEHLYPGGAGNKVPTPEIGRERMLSGEFMKKYERLHDGFVPQAKALGLPYRLEEVNNYFNGGATNVSSTFAAALWGLDFMYWWATHDAAGINFHTGDRVAAGSTLQPSKYTAFFSTTNGYLVRPLGYGIKAFELGGRGRIIPATISATATNLNLSAYATLADHKTLFVTLINKSFGAGAPDLGVRLAAGGTFLHAETMLLAAPGGDVAAQDGVTLGGSVIARDAGWHGWWTPLPAPSAEGRFTLTLPPATAAVVRLSRD
jgi:type 1 glutamine amidotransferase